jgi:aspartate--ammonia ligase
MQKKNSEKSYCPSLNVLQTEKAIELIKNFYQQQLATELKLYRITAPLFVPKGTGINDDLNGIEKPVTFSIRDITHQEVEIVQSLAKWKRLALANHGIKHGYGIYTDMNAIRPDETLDNIHSLYVDQWDWERVIHAEERNIKFLKTIVRKIYSTMRRLEFFIHDHYPFIAPSLPEEITFIHAEEAEERYPGEVGPDAAELPTDERHGEQQQRGEPDAQCHHHRRLDVLHGDADEEVRRPPDDRQCDEEGQASA